MYKGVLLDLGGVVYVGGEALPGAVEAVERLRDAGLGVRFLTNTTRQPRSALRGKLETLGLKARLEEIFMPAVAARDRLLREGLAAHLLIHPALSEDFAGLPDGEPRAVVIGDAGRYFTYDTLNAAFRALQQAEAFYALAKNRVFKDEDGELSLDAGPFVAALEYATGRGATVLGKPSEAFFHGAVESLGCEPDEAVMVGDDVEADAAGARAAGLAGILVRQGKYRDGDETRVDRAPTTVLDDLPAAVDWILEHQA